MNKWLIVGFIGQFVFFSRFLVQWICSEIKKKSYIPMSFWYLSIIGGVFLFAYSVYRKDPVFIIGQVGGLIVYSRNIRLIHKNRDV